MSKNSPRLEELKELKEFYDSERYLNLLNEFARRSNRELESREAFDMFRLFIKLSNCHGRYKILDVPFADVLSVIETNRETFLDYQVAATVFFDERHIIGAAHLMEKFCEFYLLQSGDDNRLLRYLASSKSEISFQPVKYAEKITKLYRQTVSNANCVASSLCSQRG